MLDLDLPLVLPSYMCFSRHFEGFVKDLSFAGIKKVIVLHDFDFSASNIFSHKSSIKLLRKKIAPIFKAHSIQFSIFANAFLYPREHSLRELSCICDKNSKYYFLTLPLSCDPAVAMKNIFILKNAGFIPIINNFEKMSVVFKRSFCEALLTTENICFAFDTDILSKDIIVSYINKALASENIVLMAADTFTTSVIERNIKGLWSSLDTVKRMNFGYLSRKITNQLFK